MKIDLFHIGPQKSASTWVYHCLSEHEEVCVPSTDAVHYYDMKYYKGQSWYSEFFKGARDYQIQFDPTMTYIRSPWAPRRIAEDNPETKIMTCLRNPVDRAFSHYWHEKKKGRINFEFSEVLENYDLYSSWIEPGFYAEHLERYLEYFNRDQLLCIRFETLKEDQQAFLRRICQFAGIDDDFQSTWLNRKSNEAGGKRTFSNRMWREFKRTVVQSNFESTARDLRLDDAAQYLERVPLLGKILQDRQEYEEGIDPALRAELLELCEPEIQRLENLLEIDLASWRRE